MTPYAPGKDLPPGPYPCRGGCGRTVEVQHRDHSGYCHRCTINRWRKAHRLAEKKIEMRQSAKPGRTEYMQAWWAAHPDKMTEYRRKRATQGAGK